MSGLLLSRAAAATAAFVLGIAAVGLTPTCVRVVRAEPPRAADRGSGDLIEAAVRVGTLTRLLAALRAADRVALLRETAAGPRTLFAPSDEAFAALPAGALDELLKPENVEKLRALLLRHVVAGGLRATDLQTGELQTLSGDRLTVQRDAATRSDVTVSGARIVRADLPATNGVLHVIDRVLLSPPP